MGSHPQTMSFQRYEVELNRTNNMCGTDRIFLGPPVQGSASRGALDSLGVARALPRALIDRPFRPQKCRNSRRGNPRPESTSVSHVRRLRLSDRIFFLSVNLRPG